MKLLVLIKYSIYFFLGTYNVNAFNLNVDKIKFNVAKDSLMISNTIKPECVDKFNLLLPKNQEIQKCKVFGNDKFDYRIFFNIFTVNTDFFSGDRFEIITITKDINTHRLSFVILDYYTNAMTWDPIDGIKRSNSIIYKTNENEVYKWYIRTKELFNAKNIFKLDAVKTDNIRKTLKEFTVLPNHQCYFKNFSKPFKLKFDLNMDLYVNMLNLNNLDCDIFKNEIILEHLFIYPNSMDFDVFIN